VQELSLLLRIAVEEQDYLAVREAASRHIQRQDAIPNPQLL
jgi:hypothetical protein